MKRRILVADDDIDNRTIVRDSLEVSGYEVLEATNGQEALEMATRELPDLVLLDLSMPKMDGWEVAKRLRETPQTVQIRVVAFTAHALKGDELKARAAGCDDYLSKPCSPGDVVRVVNRWLSQK